MIGTLNDTALDSFVVKVLEGIYPVISVRGYLKSSNATRTSWSPSEAASAFARAVVERCKADPAAYLNVATESLDNPDPEIRKLAIQILSYLQRDVSPDGVVKAAEHLSDPDAGVRFSAADFLRRLSVHSLANVPIAPLLTALGDQDYQESESVREAAAMILSRLRCKEAVPKLISILTKFPSGHERETIVKVLGQLGSGDNEAIKVLTEILVHDSEEYTRQAAALALINVGGETRVVIQEVMRMMRTSAGRGEPVRHMAAIIVQVQPEGVALLADILQNRREPDTMRIAASYALSQVSNGDRKIDAALRFALNDSVREVRAYASLTLVKNEQVKQALSVFVNSMDKYDYWRTNWGPTESLKTLIAVSPPDVASILNAGKLSNFELVEVIKAIAEYSKLVFNTSKT